MKKINRRSFLKSSLVTGAALSMPVRSWAAVRGANDDIRVAMVGFHGQGHSDMREYLAAPGARVVALCDVDNNVLDHVAKEFADRNEKVETYKDIRKMLENKDIDAISIATPNHWHALIAIWAIQAGKDVYVQKPISHNVSEGRRIVEAARKYGKIVQTGTQSRSSSGIREAVEYVHSGKLGKILVSRGLCYKRRGSIGKVTKPTPIPPYIDYDLWCGPAEKLPLMRERLHYDWHWVWNTGNGDLGNQGIHEMDVARWFLGEQELSPRVFSVGGRLGYVDDGETPNTMMICHDYAKAPLIFEVRGLPEKKDAKEMDNYKGAGIGIVVECENGHVLVPSYSKAIAYDKDGKEIQKFEGGMNHKVNFLKAVRSRKYTDLNADILQGHLSSALCHTGNVSHRVGKLSSPDEIRETIKGDKDAMETFGRMAEHLAKNEVDLNMDKLTMGTFLKMDPKTETFIGNSKANELLTRHYRKPFVVPEKV